MTERPDLLAQEQRLDRRIEARQRRLANLEIDSKDHPALSQAYNTLRRKGLMATITRLKEQEEPITAQLDQEAFADALRFSRKLRRMERMLRVVRASGDPSLQDDVPFYEQEVEKFRQKPFQDPFLARGIKVYNQRVSRKPEVPTPDGHELPGDAKRRELLGRIVLEESGRHVLVDGVRIVLTSPISQAVARRMHQDLLTPWGDSLGVHRDEIARIAQDHGYKGRQPGYDPIRALKDACRNNNLGIRIDSTPDPNNRRYAYYRFTTVESAIPRVDIPKFRPSAYKLPREPFPPTSREDYPNLRSLQEVMASFTRIDDDTRTLLEQFLVSPAASYAILNAMVEFNAHPRSEQETKEFFRFLAGDFLAELGHIQLQPKYQNKGLTLLSPYEKFILFRNVHQEKDIDDPSGYGTSFEIKGVPYLPDGLVICETDQALEVVEIVEYKNVTSKDKGIIQQIIEQHAHFTPEGLEHQLRLTDPVQPIDPLFLGQVIHDKLRPNLSPKPLVVNPKVRVVYAIPEGGWVPIENAEIETVHISTGEIGHFLRLLTTVLKK